LYYFTRETIKSLLKRHGFEVIEMRAHVQRLELNYLLSRGAAVSRRLANSLQALARALRLGKREVPYWIGQTFVAARLTKTIRPRRDSRPLVGLLSLLEFDVVQELLEATAALSSFLVCA
jgi:hypothetical protein